MAKTTIIIADDHPLFRAGVSAEIKKHPNLEVIAETGDGKDAFELIKKHKPNIAILDFQMPNLTGLQICKKVKAANLETPIILLTMHKDEKIFRKAINEGISGYVLKDEAVIDIINAVEAVNNGNLFISEPLKYLTKDQSIDVIEDTQIIDLIETLTPTEKKILNLISNLNTNDEIADKLFISKRTVENHKINITRKLKLQSSRELPKYIIRNKELI